MPSIRAASVLFPLAAARISATYSASTSASVCGIARDAAAALTAMRIGSGKSFQLNQLVR